MASASLQAWPSGARVHEVAAVTDAAFGGVFLRARDQAAVVLEQVESSNRMNCLNRLQ